MVLLAAFGALSLMLAAVGIYGVVGYSVTQRTHEIGIRVALGAGRGDVLRIVFAQSLKWVFAGIVVGLGASFGALDCSPLCFTASAPPIRACFPPRQSC